MKAKARYFSETDTLAIETADRPAAEAQKVADGVLVDLDAQGEVVGITIEHAADLLEEFLAVHQAMTSQRRAAAS